MRDFTEEELLRIIAAGESDHVEFKETLSGDATTKIREAICALANDLPGYDSPGLVLVGVKDDGTICDFNVTDRILQTLADMKTDGNIVPPPSMTVEKRRIQEKELALIKVQPSNSPPVRYKGAIHIRTAARRGTATARDERILNEKRRYGDRPFDLQPIPVAGVSDLNLSRFQNEYLTAAYSDELLAANDRSLYEQLAATKMTVAADLPTATVLGILTVGKSPQDFLPGAYVQFLRINGEEFSDEIIDTAEIRGAIPELLGQLEEKLASHNRTAVDIIGNSTEKRTEMFPMEALHQITRNAVMHRTYEATNAPIRVVWFNDRLEVLSPGGAFGTVNAGNFGQPGFTDYRNPNLAESMKTLGYVQRFGVGIPIAKRHLAAAGHPQPEFDISDSFVSVTVKARKDRGEAEQ